MPGFIAKPPETQPAIVANEIAGDGWYPALKLTTFKEAARIGSTVTDVRAREALLGGMMSAIVALVSWQTGQIASGVASLEGASIRGVTGRKLGDELVTVILYRRAVYAFAAADLVDTHSDISATESGRDRREARAAAADELRRDATLALRDLMARGRAKVALV